MALEIFKLVGSVFVDTDKADKSLKKTDKSAGGLGSKLLDVGKQAGKFAAAFAKATVAAGAALLGVVESTREYRNEQGKLQAAFIAAGYDAEAASNSYRGLVGVLGDSGQAVEAANHLAKLAKSEQELEEWTDICTGVYATFGDSLPIEGLTEAANETAKVGEVTGGLADALNWVSLGSSGWEEALGSNSAALKAFREASRSGEDNATAFNAALATCSTEAERAALITATMSTAYSKAGETFREVNGDVIDANFAQENLTAAMAGIGAALEPVVSLGKNLLANVLRELTPVLTTLGELIIPALSSALVAITSTVMPIFTQAVEWVAVNVLPLLSTALSTVGGWFDSIKTKLGESGVTFSSVMGVVQSLFSGAMTVIKTVWDSVGQPIWNLIKQTVGQVAGLFADNMPAIKSFVSQAFTDIKNIWEQSLKPALDAIGKFINNVLSPAFKFVFETIIAPVVKGAFKGIVDLWNNSLKPGLQAIIDFVKNVFSGDFSGAFSNLVELIGSIWGGITSVIKAPLNAVIGVVNSFIGKINRLEIPEWVPGIGGKGLDIPLIPTLEKGGVLERGQVGFLEGNGAEAVVPLHQNKAWISRVAEDMDTAIGGASGDKVTALLASILTQLEEIVEMGLYLDGDKLVGGIAHRMNRRLGQLQLQKARA